MDDLYVYSVDVLTEDEEAPYRMYLKIDGAYAGDMVLSSGTPGNGTYVFSTYLREPGYHGAVFYMDAKPQMKIPGVTTTNYALPTELMTPFNLPLVMGIQGMKSNAQPAIDPTGGGEAKRFPSTDRH